MMKTSQELNMPCALSKANTAVGSRSDGLVGDKLVFSFFDID